jgi:hypothetical protein
MNIPRNLSHQNSALIVEESHKDAYCEGQCSQNLVSMELLALERASLWPNVLEQGTCRVPDTGVSIKWGRGS